MLATSILFAARRAMSMPALLRIASHLAIYVLSGFVPGGRTEVSSACQG